DFIEPIEVSNRLVGYLQIELNDAETELYFLQNVLTIFLLVLGVFLLSSTAGLRLFRDIQHPLAAFTRGMREARDGDLSAKQMPRYLIEFNTASDMLNDMLQSIRAEQERLESNIEESEQDLRETLETIEVQNIELDLARKEALEASRIKSEFLANMSHEIRTPLNGIIGFTELLRKSPLSIRQREYAETIQKSSDGLLLIVNQILDFSKMEAGKLQLDHVPLNLRDVIEEVLTLLAPLAFEKNLEQIPLIYSDVPLDLLGDPQRLKQIITNLVNNAIKFSEDGNVIIRVSLEEESNNEVSIKVAVTDTGIGISQDEQAHLFQAFRQANASSNRRFGGTGLGLVISKHLTEQMGGHIGVESTLGKGSTFYFTFKADKAPHTHSEFPAILQQKKIAVFDPNATVAGIWQHYLQTWGASCILLNALTDAAEALQESPQWDAVVFGLSRDSDNDAATTNLLRQLYMKSIPVILAGRAPDPSLLASGIVSTAIAYIPKPVCYRKLYDACASLFGSAAIKSIALAAPTKFHFSRPVSAMAVDDNPANLKLISVLLKDLGVDTVAFDSGLKALQHVEQHPVDIIFMDIQMPGMDGVETSRRIREIEGTRKHTPIIAVTAHALESERNELLRSGLDDYLTKPISETQLVHVVSKLLEIQLDAQPAHSEALPPSSDSVLDWPLCLKLANQKTDLALDMLMMLLNSLTEDKKSIQHALETENREMLLQSVHKLHGATRYVGAPALQKAAFLYEDALRKHEQAKVIDAHAQLLQAIDDLIRWQASEHATAIFGLSAAL
ncbi:MAG TPA: response regulator, partial [Pseudomonadales bacterium]|nr:response regulator [Pseudomonadales bacterium]